MALISYFLLIFLLSLGQFSVIANIGNGKLYAFDIFAGIFVLFWILLFGYKKWKFIPPKTVFTVISFILIALGSFISNAHLYSPTQQVFSFFYLYRFVIYFLAGVVVFNLVEKKLLTREHIYWGFILSAVFMAIAGFIQLIVLPDFTVLDSSLGWDPHKNRLASTFFDPNFTGCYLVLVFTLILNKFLNKEKTNKLEYLCLLLIVGAIALTFSRSAWGMLGVIIFIYGVFKEPKLLLTSLLLIFLAYFAIPRVQTRISGITDPADSASLRIVSWRNALKIIDINPLLGIGFNNYRYVQSDLGLLDVEDRNIHSGSGTDSSLLFVLATTGIIGLISYVGFYVKNFFGAVRERNLLIIAIIAGLFLQSLFINSLFYPQIMFFIFVVFFSRFLFYTKRK